MNRQGLFRSVTAVFGALIISSCSESRLRGPTAPVQSPSDHGSDGGLQNTATSGTTLKAIWWEKSYDSGISVSKTIDASGGTISIAQTGLSVSFPKGALTSP